MWCKIKQRNWIGWSHMTLIIGLLWQFRQVSCCLAHSIIVYGQNLDRFYTKCIMKRACHLCKKDLDLESQKSSVCVCVYVCVCVCVCVRSSPVSWDWPTCTNEAGPYSGTKTDRHLAGGQRRVLNLMRPASCVNWAQLLTETQDALIDLLNNKHTHTHTHTHTHEFAQKNTHIQTHTHKHKPRITQQKHIHPNHLTESLSLIFPLS